MSKGDKEVELKRLYDEAMENMKLAHYKMAEANLALGTFEEERDNRVEAAIFYYDAGTFYRQSDAPKETTDVADEAYRRCRDILPSRFRMRKI